MGRATRKAGELTRERILEHALPLFAQHGFAGTSTRMVAGAAEVNVATLAYYFGDKKGLYLAVMERQYTDMVAAAPAALTMKSTPSETVDALVDTAWDFIKTHRTHIQLIIRHVLDAGQHEEIVDRFSEPLMEQAAAVVAMFRPDWSETHRRMLILTIMHALVRLVIEDSRQLGLMLKGADPDEAVRSWFKAMLKRELGIE